MTTESHKSTNGKGGVATGRPPAVQARILQALRGEIVAGAFPLGTQLPTRRELETRYEASLSTVQDALSQLEDEGFIVSRGRLGTFMAEDAPHLTRYGLIFNTSPTDGPGWGRLYRVLSSEAQAVNGGRRLECFFGVQPHSDNAAYLTLRADLATHRFAGLIFAVHPYAEYGGDPLVTAPGVARVGIMGEAAGAIPAVVPDYDAWVQRALTRLRERGCKRLAVVANIGNRERVAALATQAPGFGMSCPPYWQQFIHLHGPECARNCVHLLMQAPAGERPDGLLVLDDNLEEHVAAGLVAAGVRVGEDLHVVCHCNFPWPSPAVLPFERLGFCVPDMLSACFTLLDRQAQGGASGPDIVASAVFESEYVAKATRRGAARPIGVPTLAAPPARAGDHRMRLGRRLESTGVDSSRLQSTAINIAKSHTSRARGAQIA